MSPFDIAMQLLKEVGRAESSPTLMGNPKATAYISQNKDPAKLPCSVCDGKILQQPCRKCGRPASLGADVLTGEPMDIAMQLLKESYQSRLPGGPSRLPRHRRLRRTSLQPKGGQPARLHVEGDRFSLLDYDDNVLSQLEHDDAEIGSKSIEGHYAHTPELNRRRGHYQDLLEAALRHGYDVISDQRNESSHPFHKKFLTNLPPDIKAQGAHGIDTDSDFISNLNERDGIYYSGKYSPGNAIGWGDLQTDSRSKVPMTYETDYQRYQDRLNRGINANTDIRVREPDGVKNYVQSRLDLSMEKPVPRWGGMMGTNRSGGEAWHGDGRFPMLPTNQGIGVPKGTSYDPAFNQTDRPFHDINFAPSLQAGAVGINPRRLTRLQHIQQQS